MARTQSDLTPGTHHSQSAANSLDSAPMVGQGLEPELQAINSESVSGLPAGEDRPQYFKQVFAKQKWHKPYADALMEGDTQKLASAIAKAERAIFNRYLELSTAEDHSDERMDLCRAVEALRELKRGLDSADTRTPAVT
jgi:hypothetical protein